MENRALFSITRLNNSRKAFCLFLKQPIKMWKSFLRIGIARIQTEGVSRTMNNILLEKVFYCETFLLILFPVVVSALQQQFILITSDVAEDIWKSQ